MKLIKEFQYARVLEIEEGKYEVQVCHNGFDNVDWYSMARTMGNLTKALETARGLSLYVRRIKRAALEGFIL